MTQNELPLTGSLARAARALVETSSSHTASAAGLTGEQLRDFEKGLSILDAQQIAALKLALESLGAFFVADGQSGRGYGVRLKFSNARVEKVEAWESEGGLAAEDDV